MNETRDLIENEASEHKYFHQMLNMAEDDLDPFEYRLLAHYVRWSNLKRRKVEGYRKTAKLCQMSPAKVLQARQALIDKGYIKHIPPTAAQANKGVGGVVVVLDRWADNVKRYAEPSPKIDQVDDKPGLNIDQKKERSTGKKEDSAAKNAAPTIPDENIPVATKKQKSNPWYDAIHAVWRYNGDMNGAMFKMLQGKATAPAWKVGNLPKEHALTDPAQLLTWAAWYRKTELGDNPKLSMLEERLKIQSSILEWQSLGCPDVDTPPLLDASISTFPIPDDVFDTWMHTNGSGELSAAKFAHRQAGGVWDDTAETAWLRAYKAAKESK